MVKLYTHVQIVHCACALYSNMMLIIVIDAPGVPREVGGWGTWEREWWRPHASRVQHMFSTCRLYIHVRLECSYSTVVVLQLLTCVQWYTVQCTSLPHRQTVIVYFAETRTFYFSVRKSQIRKILGSFRNCKSASIFGVRACGSLESSFECKSANRQSEFFYD